MNDQIMGEEMTYKHIKRGVLSLMRVIKEMKIKTTKKMSYYLTSHQSGKKGGLSRPNVGKNVEQRKRAADGCISC